VLVRPPRRPRVGHRGRRSPGTSAAGFDWHFRRDGHELVVRCNFERGWRPTERSWRFCASAQGDLPNDRTMRVGVTLSEGDWGQWQRRYAGPGLGAIVVAPGSDNPDPVAPRFEHLEGTSGAIRYVLNDEQGEFFTTLFDQQGKLNTHLPWLRDGRLWRIQLSEYGLYERPIRLQDGRCVARPFHVEVTVTVHPPRRPDAPVVRDFDLPFPSAGLVSPR
jgi:hypothetical protein